MTSNYWDNPEFDLPDFDFVDLDKVGTPIYVKILDWNKIHSLTFSDTNGNPFTSDYLETDKGLLRIDSKRLKKGLKEFVGKKGLITIQRWIEGKDNRSAVYKVSLEPLIVSKKKPKK
ncbi:unnamed protein product [marine sediment metagenome]|uniref:Uncharacterized protein n=1 Tax=marine sediment metagenome TaxID=412755 RepID=X0ZU16_9ZZZZ